MKPSDLLAPLMTMTDAKRDRVALLLVTWLAHVRKKGGEDHTQRVAKFARRIKSMAAGMTLECVRGEFVVRVEPKDHMTLMEIRRGTNWFDPYDKSDEHIAAAILST